MTSRHFYQAFFLFEEQNLYIDRSYLKNSFLLLYEEFFRNPSSSGEISKSHLMKD